MQGLSIAGRKRHSDADLYETPAWATQALLAREPFVGDVLEPACGYGAISDRLKKNMFEVRSSDKYDYGYGEVRDFLSDYPPSVPNIVTNPPYNQAKEFIQVSKMVATDKIAMLLKLSFLEGLSRIPLFADTKFPLARVWVFSRRVQMYPHGAEKPKNSGTIAYAWFVWDKKHVGDPQIKWIQE
jgi:hypothetical protein